MDNYQLERLKLAFAHSFAGNIIDADGELDVAELAFIAEMFPNETMQTCGFVDLDGRYTDEYKTAVEESMKLLPEALSKADKVGLIQTLFGAAIADGHFHFREGNVLMLAGQLLGMDGDEITNAMDQELSMGEIDLPAPEVE